MPDGVRGERKALASTKSTEQQGDAARPGSAAKLLTAKLSVLDDRIVLFSSKENVLEAAL